QTQYTISNAMDVGNPSNFPRILELYHKLHPAIANDIKGYWYSDDQTRSAMYDIFKQFAYQSDPHGAIAYAGLKEFGIKKDNFNIFLETAHPAKFSDEAEKSAIQKVQIPDILKKILLLEKNAVKIPNDYFSFKKHLKQLI
ncbi:MAG: threonine synthase, partial [Bacteroidetes bacterium]|nr:threonine synthase [Bacteroidota bacterium]